MKTIKIGNVTFYKVIDNPSKPQEDIWLTHDGEYGLFRFYGVKGRREWAICKNNRPHDCEHPEFSNFSLERINNTPYKFVRGAMKFICENYYGEEVK